MSPLRSLGLLTSALALAAAAMAADGGRSAQAGWPPSTVTGRTGALRVAVVGHLFTMVAGMGTGGVTYSANKLLTGTTTGYVDLGNAGTVPVTVAGTVSLSTFLSTTVTISRCSTVWSAGACPGTQTTLMSTMLSAKANVTWSSGAVAPGDAVHLKVVLGGSVANQVTLTAAPQAARTAGDRTAG